MAWTNAHKWCIANADNEDIDTSMLDHLLQSDIDSTDEILSTCLHYAALGTSCATASYLLKLGFSSNTANINGETPLHYASSFGNAKMVRLLLDAKANPSIQDEGVFSCYLFLIWHFINGGLI